MSTPDTTDLPVDLADPARCARCGYDLRGLTEARCPECGMHFDPNARPRAAMPWFERRHIGSWRAYWGTVALVLLRPRQFGSEVWRAGDAPPHDGMRFRFVTIGVAAGSMLASVLALDLAERVLPPSSIIVMAAIVTGTFLWLYIGTGQIDATARTHSVPPRIFDRLRRFSCAGLATSPIVPISTAVTLLIPGLGASLVLLSLATVGLAWWWGEVAYQYWGGRFGIGSVALFGAFLPVFWLLSALLIGVLVAFVFAPIYATVAG